MHATTSQSLGLSVKIKCPIIIIIIRPRLVRITVTFLQKTEQDEDCVIVWCIWSVRCDILIDILTNYNQFMLFTIVKQCCLSSKYCGCCRSKDWSFNWEHFVTIENWTALTDMPGRAFHSQGRAGILMHLNGPGRAWPKFCRAGLGIFGPCRALVGWPVAAFLLRHPVYA